MDAKPQRPLRAFLSQPTGNENPAVASHAHYQSQKSNVNSKVMAVPNGLKVAAKRTAMGDVSNVYHAPLLVHHGTKTRAAETAASNQQKEVGSQGAFHAPAQRPKSIPPTSYPADPQPKALGGSRIVPKSKDLRDIYASLAVKHELSTQDPVIFCDNNGNEQPRRNNPAEMDAAVIDFALKTDADRKSPRHYKSQPNLKPEQPLLRRTKSRVLATVPEPVDAQELIYFGVDSDVVAPYVDAVEEFEPVGAVTGYAVDAQQDDPEDDQEDAASEVYPEEQVKSQSIGGGGASLVGQDMEEYWDDDEEFYDDQAYTTAHSYRSTGDDTAGGVTSISSRSVGDDTAGGVTTRIVPKITSKAQKEIEAAKFIVESNLSPYEIEEEAWDMTMVTEYGNEIFEYMRELELRMMPNPHYMDDQAELQWSMRSIMMEWVVQVHTRFGLLPETLFLAVNYIDRFLSGKVVSVGKLQLVGATAILIAAKYEEINCPSVSEMVYMVDHGYTTEEILKAERFMLTLLNFELGWPGPMSFLRRVSKADDYDLETRTLAKYFLEVTIMDERFVGSPPSFLAAGAHALSRFLLRKADWSPAHVYYSGYTWAQLKPVAQVIWDCCQSPRVHHPSIYDKYSDRRFKKASIFVEEEVLKSATPSFLVSTPAGSLQTPNILQMYEDAFYGPRQPLGMPPCREQDMGLPIPIEG